MGWISKYPKWTPFGIVEWCSEDPDQCILYKSKGQQQWTLPKGYVQTHRAHQPDHGTLEAEYRTHQKIVSRHYTAEGRTYQRIVF